MNNDNNHKIILATGGTGGHIFPAITVSKIIKDAGLDAVIVSDTQLDKYKNHLEVKHKIIDTGKNKSLKSIIKIIFAIIKSFFLLKKEKPDLIIGFGSYATFPILVVAKLLKIKILLHEQNSHLGKVNRWFSKYASFIMTSFPEIYGVNIDYSNKIKYVGNPIRNNILNLINNVYKYPDLEKEKFNILIIGGSGGATFFANQLLNSFRLLDNKKKIHVVHQVRQDDLIKTKEFYSLNNISSEVKIFFDDMEERYKKAHLIICRSGATTMFELFAVGVPTIFIPSPNVANNHQYFNAKVVVEKDACILVEEKDFKEAEFAKMLDSLILDKNKLETLGNNIRKLYNSDTNTKIRDIIKSLLNK